MKISIIYRAMQIFKTYYILYLFLNITIVPAFDKDLNDRQQVIKMEQLLNKPVYTFVKTDKHANIKWGVRHYIPRIFKRMDFNN